MSRGRAVQVTIGDFTLSRVTGGIEVRRQFGEFEQCWTARNWSEAMNSIDECKSSEPYKDGKPVRWQS